MYLPQALGQVGRVVNFEADYDAQVVVNGRRWLFNPKCLDAASVDAAMDEDG